MTLENPIALKSRFTKKHLLIIGILALSFSIAFLARSQPVDYGFQLNEFDPFFNYRATNFIIENGIDEYFSWNDSLSWYPNGRDISKTSQVMLHITTAISYWIFGGSGNLYEFTILFPIVVGSLSTIVVFALVRTIYGTTAGLLSSLLFAISIPVIVRGMIGWFKSEPLGLFYGLISIYLLLSGIKSKNHKFAILKLVGAGIILSFSISSWGGSQFFLIPIGVFFLSLPFVRKDHKFLVWAIPLFSVSLLVTSMFFERIAGLVTGLGGLAIIGPTLFLVACIFVQSKSSDSNKTRNGLLLLFAVVLSGIALLAVNMDTEFINMPSFRYLNAINPFLTTTDPLVDSVAEHASTNIQQSFFFHTSLMIFAAIGIWILLSRKDNLPIKPDMISFSLIFGITGIYISSAFVRLEVFASIGLIILSSISISLILNKFVSKSNNLKPSLVFISGIIILLALPIIIPGNANHLNAIDAPPTILNGGTQFSVATNDWLSTLNWIKNNTPQDAVIASWWDYGYWIQTLSERATLADNSTIDTKRIQNIAKMLLSTPDDAWQILQEMEADYVMVFVSSEQLNIESPEPYYLLHGGGDESKKQWFIRIAEEPLGKYLHSDGISGTDHFWNNTLLGKMFPFTPILYADFNNGVQYDEYRPGTTPIYVKENKFTGSNEPFQLVYASPSYQNEKPGPVLGVFVYEINKNYVPNS